jgi:hypothetical protein
MRYRKLEKDFVLESGSDTPVALVRENILK